MADEITARLSSLITAEVRFSLETPDAEKFIGSKTVVELDDGTRTRIALQGHGLQRALVFALIEVLATRAAAVQAGDGEAPHVRGTVLLFEEPELFIHPHVMRRLKVALEAISQQPDWQVIVTTHSPFLVDVGRSVTSLVIHRRPDPQAAPNVRQLENDPFSDDAKGVHERDLLNAVLNLHPTVCEAFFARRVVLVEGPSEIAVLTNRPALLELAGIDNAAAREISVISCAGKLTIVPLARVLRAFDVPLRVVHDVDAKDRTPEQLEQTIAVDPWRANERISAIAGEANTFRVEDTLEHLLWPEDNGGSHDRDKPYKAWKQVGALCEGATDLEHVPGLRDLVRFVYGTD